MINKKIKTFGDQPQKAIQETDRLWVQKNPVFRLLLSTGWEGGPGQFHGKRANLEKESLAERKEFLPFFGSRGKRDQLNIKGLTVVEKRPRPKDFDGMLRYFYRSI